MPKRSLADAIQGSATHTLAPQPVRSAPLPTAETQRAGLVGIRYSARNLPDIQAARLVYGQRINNPEMLMGDFVAAAVTRWKAFTPETRAHHIEGFLRTREHTAARAVRGIPLATLDDARAGAARDSNLIAAQPELAVLAGDFGGWVYTLAVRDGCTIADIAERTGATRPTINSALNRVRERFRNDEPLLVKPTRWIGLAWTSLIVDTLTNTTD